MHGEALERAAAGSRRHPPERACLANIGQVVPGSTTAFDITSIYMIPMTPQCKDWYQMGSLNVRNLSDQTHKALRIRAAQHGRSTEAEVRAILDEAVRPKERVGLGSMLTAIGQDFGGVDLDIARDKTPPEPATFE
jgi:plasmid stability protein